MFSFQFRVLNRNVHMVFRGIGNVLFLMLANSYVMFIHLYLLHIKFFVCGIFYCKN